LGLILGLDALVALLLGSCLGALDVALVAMKRLTWKDPVPLGLF
jgi:hypothetical protein